MRFEYSTEITRPAAEVFAFLSHHPNHTKIVKQNAKSEQLDPGPMKVGTRVRNTARFLWLDMVETFEVTELEESRTLAKRSLPGSTFETSDRFEVEETPNGARVRLVVTGTPHGTGQRVLFRLLGPAFDKAFADILPRLKSVLESERN